MKDDMPQPRKVSKEQHELNHDAEIEDEYRAQYYETISAVGWLAFGVASAALGGLISWWMFAGGCI